MNKILLVNFLLFLVLTPMAQAGVQERSFNYDDSLRTYILYVPESYEGGADWPLVINLHGYLGSAEQQMTYSDMNAVADMEHFLVAYPNGLTMTSTLSDLPPNGQGWNSSPEGDRLYFSADNVDDAGFLVEIINHIDRDYKVSSDRVYAVGFSSGGSMSYRLACEQSEVFAAIASVAGPARATLPCEPARVIPILHIHGTTDPNFEYDGPGDSFTKSREETIGFWADQNSCNEGQSVREYPNINLADSSTAELQQLNNCKAEVAQIKVTGGGHHWPGSNNLYFPPFFGNLNLDINGSNEIWNFFNRNPALGTVVEATGTGREID
jgi:polyhydroxybutyrate depolymerase